MRARVRERSTRGYASCVCVGGSYTSQPPFPRASSQGADETGSYAAFGERRKAICEMKHFDAYSVEDGRNGLSDNANISLRDLVDYYFVPLQTCIEEADVGAFMCSYNAINGTAACGNKWLNVDVARNTWNFTGVIESDCGALAGIVDHRSASNQTEAAVVAVEATVDVECDDVYKHWLLNVTEDGQVHRAALEAAAARMFKGRFQIGEFDVQGATTAAGSATSAATSATSATPPWEALTTDDIFSAAHQRIALEGAQQSAVLLRNPANAGAAHLPLKRGLNIAVVGPNGNVQDVFQGQYHGHSCPGVEGWSGSYDCLPTALSEITKANVGGTTTYPAGGCALTPSASDGSGHPEGQPCASLENMTTVIDAVKGADVVLLFLGLDIKMTNKEGQDRNHDWTGYALPGMQQELARQIASVGKPVVVVELSGMAVGMDYIAAQDQWPLVVGGYGGRYGPEALAQILFGDISPTGRLPYTIYPEVRRKLPPLHTTWPLQCVCFCAWLEPSMVLHSRCVLTLWHSVRSFASVSSLCRLCVASLSSHSRLPLVFLSSPFLSRCGPTIRP